MPIFLPFDYKIDPLSAIDAVRDLPHTVLLDAESQGPECAPTTVLGVDPIATVAVRDGSLAAWNLQIETATRAPEETPAEQLALLLDELSKDLPVDRSSSGGFRHGLLLGYFGYDLCTQFENVTAHPSPPCPEPAAWWGVYPIVAVWDHHQETACVTSSEHLLRCTTANVDWQANARRLHDRICGCTPFRAKRAARSPDAEIWSAARASFSRQGYREAVGTLKNHIARGDIYQANLTIRFEWERHERDPIEAYAALRSENERYYGGYLDLNPHWILSASPELFIRRAGSAIVTSPIKGTIERERQALDLDSEALHRLQASEKDAAEHIMIVDLERNDLGRICNYGSVRPGGLRYTKSSGAVHHLVTDVTGELREEITLADVLRATLPGGSITGAPKIRAMELIREVEPVPRGLYTGSMGWIEPGGDFSFNIAIRTAVKTEDRIALGVGGAIVADSEPEAEYRECLLKGSSILCACI